MERTYPIGLLALLAAPVCADGMFAAGIATEDMLGERVAGKSGVASTEQKGIIIQLPEDREALLLQTTYHGPADRFAWVIPVPGKPGKDDVFLASTEFIDALLDTTRPEVHTTITDPVTRRGHALGKMGGEGMAPGSDMEGGGAQPTVTVHERMEVGDYDVAVLSATGAEVLTDWLRQNRYQIPDDSDDVLGHYVEKSWYFVAVKMQPGKVEERPVLEDVAPIGIRFATKQLVYPLYISRASSRQKTALLLVVLSDNPIACDQLADARLPLGKRFGKGTCYAAIRRQAVDGAKPAAVCEFRGPQGMPYIDLHYRKDSWGGEEGRGWSPGFLWTTRFWTLLDLDELEDFTFSPSSDKRTLKLHVSRTGEIYHPITERVTATSKGLLWLYAVTGAIIFALAHWAAGRGLRPRAAGATVGVVIALVLSVFLTFLGPLAGLIIIVGGVVWVVSLLPAITKDDPSDRPTPSPREWLGGLLLAAGMGAFGCIAYSVLFGGSHFLYSDVLGREIREVWRGESPTWVALSLSAIQLLWVFLVVEAVVKGARGTGRRAAWIAVPWLALLAILGLLMRSGRSLADVLADVARAVGPGNVPLPTPDAAFAAAVLALAPVTFAALLLLISYAMVGAFVSPNARRTAQPLAHTLIGLVVVSGILSSVGIATAHAGSGGYIATGTRELDSALQNLDDMLTRFRTRHGCYPARLADMLATATPTEGVDSSGNRVAIAPSAGPASARETQNPLGPGFPATELPSDVLTGRNDTWVYEPTGSPMIDSGGYEIVIEAREVAPPDKIASWQPDRPLRTDDGRDLRQRSYWHSDRDMIIPFAAADDRIFNQGTLSRDSTVLRRLMKGREGYRIVLADVGQHAAEIGTDEPGLDAFAWAPDGLHFVYASNARHATRVSTNTIFGGSGERRSLLSRPWPVEVYDVDWHPVDEKWLVLARDLEGDARARIYLLAADGEPKPLTEPDTYVVARFTPDGTGILAIATEQAWKEHLYDTEGIAEAHLPGRPGPGHQNGPVTGTLWRLSAAGRREAKLAEDAVFPLLTQGPSGTLAVLGGYWEDKGLLYFDKARIEHRVDLPVPHSLVVDAWLGEQRLVVAVLHYQGGAPGTYLDLGDVWDYDLATGKWHAIARFEASTHSSMRPERRMVVGRDASTGAYVLTDQDYANPTVYAVRSAQPRVEVLTSPRSLHATRAIEVSIAGKRQTVIVEGLYEPRAFEVGDLIATSPGTATPVSALPVAMKDGARILVGGRWIDSPADAVPILSELRTKYYAKLRPS